MVLNLVEIWFSFEIDTIMMLSGPLAQWTWAFDSGVFASHVGFWTAFLKWLAPRSLHLSCPWPLTSWLGLRASMQIHALTDDQPRDLVAGQPSESIKHQLHHQRPTNQRCCLLILGANIYCQGFVYCRGTGQATRCSALDFLEHA